VYNKLFTKILDSSVWLAPDPHRLVWITLIAAMDQNSFCAFACIENLAARARVSVHDTAEAIAAFMAPDPRDPEQEYEGRRIERVQGGWFVLNGQKHRNTVTRAIENEQSRLRMQRFRQRQRNDVQPLRNVTQPKRNVTPSYQSKAVAEQSSMSARKNAQRLPSDFALTDELRAVAVSEHLDPERTFASAIIGLLPREPMLANMIGPQRGATGVASRLTGSLPAPLQPTALPTPRRSTPGRA
jgi:hypothetical protein